MPEEKSIFYLLMYYTFICMYIRTYIHTYICVCMYVCTYVHMYTSCTYVCAYSIYVPMCSVRTDQSLLYWMSAPVL